MSQRMKFPTLADVSPDQWPPIHVTPADGRGTPTLVRCRCQRAVPADEIIDLRELDTTTQSALGIARPVLCAACFHHAQVLGAVLHDEIATALGLDPAVVASLNAASRESLTRGWHAATPRNGHLR